MKTNLALIERESLLKIERQEARRREVKEVTEGMAETIALERARGAEIVTPKPGRGEKAKPARRVLPLDGLDFLKPKLTPKQFDAGRRFEAFWRATHRSDTKSCLNIMDGGRGLGYSHAEALIYGRGRIADAFTLVGGHNGMWTALVQVCGEGKRPTQVTPIRREYERLETQLGCALAILAARWGL